MMTMMIIVRTGAKMMMIKEKGSLRLGDSLITNFEEIKLERFDSKPIALEIAKILQEHLPMIEFTKVFQNLDFVTRYKVELVFAKPAMNLSGHKIEGISLTLSGMRKVTNEEESLSWKEITPKD